MVSASSGIAAIASLREDTNANAASSVVAPGSENAGHDTAERRQVTVMFSDLVGSTSLAARMDPEDLPGDHHRLSEMRRRARSKPTRLVCMDQSHGLDDWYLRHDL